MKKYNPKELKCYIGDTEITNYVKNEPIKFSLNIRIKEQWFDKFIEFWENNEIAIIDGIRYSIEDINETLEGYFGVCFREE